MHLKTEMSKIDSSYDVYYQKIDTRDITWTSVLDAIKSELEAHFLDNNDSMDGIKFSIEIVKEIPDDVDFDN